MTDLDDFHVRETDAGPVGPVANERRRRSPGRRRLDLPPAAVVLLALIDATMTVVLAYLAAR